MSKIKNSGLEWINKIGDDIIRCDRQCLGVRNDKSAGCYPRGLFIDPDSSHINVVVVGENPGKASRLEKLCYQILGELYKDEKESYEKYNVRVGRKCFGNIYTKRTIHLLNELGLISEKLSSTEENESTPKDVLWTEVSFCEAKKSKITTEIFQDCSNRFLAKITKRLEYGTYVICLGKTPFEYIKNLINEKNYKIIKVPHPSYRQSSKDFFNLFENINGIYSHKNKLKKEVLLNFKEKTVNHNGSFDLNSYNFNKKDEKENARL